jgi:iron-sulfur cluster repair protein YtfE (RIC family)
MLTKYDPERAPDPVRWLAESEAQLIDIIQRYHRRQRTELPRPRIHAVLHMVVENQIAMGDEVAVAATVQRLVRDGLSRHEAIHAVMHVLLPYMARVAQEEQPFDTEGYNQDLRALTEESWRAAFAEDAD